MTDNQGAIDKGGGASSTTGQVHKKGSEAEGESKRDLRNMIAASSELLFVILPFIIIAIVQIYRGEMHRIFYLPEWSIVSSVILGQSLIRLASCAFSRGRVRIVKEGTILLMTVVIVLCLVPELMILAIVLLNDDKVSIGLAWVQAIAFVVSLIVFWGSTLLDLDLDSDK